MAGTGMWSACPSSRLTGSLLSAAEVVRAVVCLTAGVELSIDAGDVSLPATLDVPPVGPVRGAVVVLHGSAVPQRSYFLYEHLARELPRAGVAVLRFDRRLHEHGDVPFAVQADDTVAAVAELRRRMGDVRVGLWGWSQGTWPALVVAPAGPNWSPSWCWSPPAA